MISDDDVTRTMQLLGFRADAPEREQIRALLERGHRLADIERALQAARLR